MNDNLPKPEIRVEAPPACPRCGEGVCFEIGGPALHCEADCLREKAGTLTVDNQCGWRQEIDAPPGSPICVVSHYDDPYPWVVGR